MAGAVGLEREDMAKRKETETNSGTENLPIITAGPDEKQKFLEKLTKAGYEVSYENGVVMVQADTDYKKTVESVHQFAKKEGYGSSYGIVLKKG